MRPHTGVAHYALNLLRNLLRITDDLSVQALAISMGTDRSWLGPEMQGRVKLTHLRLPNRLMAPAWEKLGFPRADRALGRADVAHGVNFWIPPLTRANGIITIHDLTFWKHPEWWTSGRHLQRLVPKALRRCAMVITPSETIKLEVASELGFPTDRIVVTPEGVRGNFATSRPDPRHAASLGIKDPYLLFVGSQQPRKNLDLLLEAFGRVQGDLQLVVAGPYGWGPDPRETAIRLNLGERILFTGYLTDDVLASLMAGCRAFVYPSLYEGFGLPALEAMAAGVPVVAARAGALPEVLGEAPFWCDPADVDSVEAAILKVANDESARRDAVAAGFERAARYNWEDTARLTLEAYRRVAQAA